MILTRWNVIRDVRFWSGGKFRAPAPSLAEPARIRTSIFIWLLVYCLLLQIFIYVLFAALGRGRGLAEYLEFWKCLDSGHYVDIARDWYLSEGSRDRVVQLVFLPGYPLAMRLMHLFVRDWVLSGLLVNAFVDWTPPKWCDRLCQKLYPMLM